MSTRTKQLNTSATSIILTADSRKGQRAVALFRDQYNAALLDDERGQFLNENPAFPVALRRLIEEYSMPVQAPEGGRICIVRVPVDPGRDWQKAIDAAGPNTGADWAIRKVGDQYPAEASEPRDEEMILVNFGKIIPNAQYAIDWAQPFGLVPKKPRAVFALGEHKPTLHRELGQNVLAVISPVPCSFGGGRRVPGSWWDGAKRDAGLYWFDCSFDGHCWFAFGREEASAS